MKKIFHLMIIALALLSCAKEDFGITDIDNPRAEKKVTMYGETVAVKFNADGPWFAELKLQGSGEWAEISQMKGIESAGPGIVRVRFTKNETEEVF